MGRGGHGAASADRGRRAGANMSACGRNMTAHPSSHMDRAPCGANSGDGAVHVDLCLRTGIRRLRRASPKPEFRHGSPVSAATAARAEERRDRGAREISTHARNKPRVGHCRQPGVQNSLQPRSSRSARMPPAIQPNLHRYGLSRGVLFAHCVDLAVTSGRLGGGPSRRARRRTWRGDTVGMVES